MPPIERKGWKLYAHPAFMGPFQALVREVGELRARDRRGVDSHPKAKLLRRILDLVLEEIPTDPNAREYQLGNTLGPESRHWRRAKFLERFRLFYRFHSKEKIIVFAWVNGEKTLRERGGRNDPYEVFKKRLTRGDPPGDWTELLRSAAPMIDRPE